MRHRFLKHTFVNNLFNKYGGNKALKFDFLVLLLVVLIIIVLPTHVTAAQKRTSTITDNEMRLLAQNAASMVDIRIQNMKVIANSIANDEHIHNWVDNGFDPAHEALLLNKLTYFVKHYNLTSASFADKTTHKYWNHEGFLRELTPAIDTWYFAYLQSQKHNLISVYHDKNKNRVDLYVNFQQIPGNGLSGIATPFNGVIDKLNSSPLAQQGQLFLVNANGLVEVHHNPKVAGAKTLQQLYNKDVADKLIANQGNLSTLVNHNNMRIVSVFIPSMNWFLVAEIKSKS